MSTNRSYLCPHFLREYLLHRGHHGYQPQNSSWFGSCLLLVPLSEVALLAPGDPLATFDQATFSIFMGVKYKVLKNMAHVARVQGASKPRATSETWHSRCMSSCHSAFHFLYLFGIIFAQGFPCLIHPYCPSCLNSVETVHDSILWTTCCWD